MGYQDVRFAGFYLHEDEGFRRAEGYVKQEFEARKPDSNAPGGYAPDPEFQKHTDSLGQQIRTLFQSMGADIKAGQDIPRKAVVTLERAEELYAKAKPYSLETAFRNTEMLKEGKNPSGHGLSYTQQIRQLMGDDARPSRNDGASVTVSFRPLAR